MNKVSPNVGSFSPRYSMRSSSAKILHIFSRRHASLCGTIGSWGIIATLLVRRTCRFHSPSGTELSSMWISSRARTSRMRKGSALYGTISRLMRPPAQMATSIFSLCTVGEMIFWQAQYLPEASQLFAADDGLDSAGSALLLSTRN